MKIKCVSYLAWAASGDNLQTCNSICQWEFYRKQIFKVQPVKFVQMLQTTLCFTIGGFSYTLSTLV